MIEFLEVMVVWGCCLPKLPYILNRELFKEFWIFSDIITHPLIEKVNEQSSGKRV